MTEEAALPTTLDFDFTDEELDNVETLPPARYKGEIISSEVKLRKSGNMGLDLQVRVPPDEFPVDFEGVDFPDGMVAYYRFLPWDGSSRPAVRRMRKFCNKVGVEFHSGLSANDLVGHWGYWDVTVEEDLEGDPRNNIVAVHDEAE